MNTPKRELTKTEVENAVIRFTTAPANYDYSQVLESNDTEWVDHRNRTWREVVIDGREPHRVTAQIQRYESGLHPVWTYREWADEIDRDGGLVSRPQKTAA